MDVETNEDDARVAAATMADELHYDGGLPAPTNNALKPASSSESKTVQLRITYALKDRYEDLYLNMQTNQSIRDLQLLLEQRHPAHPSFDRNRWCLIYRGHLFWGREKDATTILEDLLNSQDSIHNIELMFGVYGLLWVMRAMAVVGIAYMLKRLILN